MSTQYLDQLARQLKIKKSPACCRAINRILAEVKKRCQAGEYRDQNESEEAFRKLVEGELNCQTLAKHAT
jgi:hypothetical protein